MSKKSFWQDIRSEIAEGYEIIFLTQWPAWISGIFLAFLATLIFLWWHTWGVAGGYNNWGNWIYYLIGIFDTKPDKSPLLNGMSVSNIGIVVGALASALLSKQFKINPAPKIEYIKGLAGGALMGIGAALAAGCNVGGFYCAIGMFDPSGFMMMIGLFAGAYLGLRYLLWEMEHLPAQTMKGKTRQQKNWDHLKPYLGGVIILLVLAAFKVYALYGQTQMGGLLFFGFLIGIVMHRGRFCFANSFREPFMTGNGEMMRAVIVSLLLYAGFTAVIKWAYIQPPAAGVYHPFFIGALLGGFIFGFGMLLAGGCASGTLWRAGEGHIKLWIALIGFFLSNAPMVRFIHHSSIRKLLGTKIFLPKVLGWPMSLIGYLLILLFLYLVLIWNERTEKFVVF